jgi:hypothetical protein
MIRVDSCVFLNLYDKSRPENQTKRGEIDSFRTISKVFVYNLESFSLRFCSKRIDFRAILRNTMGTPVDWGLSANTNMGAVGAVASGTLWLCAAERAGLGQPTQFANRSRAVGVNRAKAAQAGLPRQGQPRPSGALGRTWSQNMSYEQSEKVL